MTVVRIAYLPIMGKNVFINRFRISSTKFTVLDCGTDEDNYIFGLLVRYLKKYWSRIRRFASFAFPDLDEVNININLQWAGDNSRFYKCQSGIKGIAIVSWIEMTENETKDVLEIGFLLRHELYHMLGYEEMMPDHPGGYGLELAYSRYPGKLCVFKPSYDSAYKVVDKIDVPKELILAQIAGTISHQNKVISLEL